MEYFSENPFDALAEVHASARHGLGVFARDFIPKGTIWWQARPEDVLIISRTQFEVLNASAQSPYSQQFLDAVLNFSYVPADLDDLVYILDGGRFVNHSDDPNSIDHPSKLQSIALRDIEAGEEIVEDYAHFGKCTWAPLYGEFGKTLWD